MTSSTTTNSEPPTRPQFRLLRSSDEAKLGGICAGLAATTGVDIGAVRLVAAVGEQGEAAATEAGEQWPVAG